MEPAEGARSFLTSGNAYDRFMGRYSRQLAGAFADAAGVQPGQRVVDIGCGPGALTTVLVDRLGADSVAAFDPSAPFVDACRALHPDVDIRVGRAEAIPFDDASFDCALAQLVLHFVTEPGQAALEFRRVLRPGGTVGACVWDFAAGMEMLRRFWDAALTVDPGAPDEARHLRFGREGEISELFDSAGFDDIVEIGLEVSSTYQDFDELWSGFMEGIGPAGAYCIALPDASRAAVRDEMFRRLDSPTGPFTLGALARCATGRSPG